MTRCRACNREIKDMNKAVSCGGGEYLGPQCAKKEIPGIDRVLRDYAALRDSLSRDEMKKHPLENYRPLSGHVTDYLITPDSIDMIDVDSLIDFNFYEGWNRDNENTTVDTYEMDQNTRARAIFTYLKIFCDPSLDEDVFDFYHNDLNLRMVGVNAIGKSISKETGKHKSEHFSSFVITADNSPFPERMLLFQMPAQGTIRPTPIMIQEGRMIMGCSGGHFRDPFNSNGIRKYERLDMRNYIAAWFMMDNPLEAPSFRHRMGSWKLATLTKEKTEGAIFFDYPWDLDEPTNDAHYDLILGRPAKL